MQIYRYKENKTHGSTQFPMEIYHIEANHPQYIMPLHWHMETEIIHVYSGSMRLYLNDREHSMFEGDTAIIAGGVLHSALPDNCIYECLVFNSEILRRTGFYALEEGYDGHDLLFEEYYNGENIEIKQLVVNLFGSVLKEEKAYRFASYGYLCHLWALLIRQGHVQKSTGQTAPQLKKLKRVLRMIEREYANKISLADMAGEAGMSEKYFCRFFMQLTHRSPMDYLNNYRVERACVQIEKGNSTITEIALDCGFNDLSYFIRVFKKYKGVTPRGYEQLLQGNIKC